MLVKPNESFLEDIAPNDYENDLYRKFHRVYSEILHPDNNTYNSEIYCETKNNVEKKVMNVLNNASDGIVPILGYVGMGKTFLMHYCIRKKYNYKDIIKNRAFIGEDNGQYDLVIYSSYDAARREEVTKGRLGGKLADACDKVLKWLRIPNDTEYEKEEIFDEVVKYIQSNKGELPEEYSETPVATVKQQVLNMFEKDRTAYEAERLKWILTSYNTKIKNVVIVLDDIEGYIGKHKQHNNNEYELIDTYESIYDCLRRYTRDKNNFNVKLFICMRERTYNEVCKQSWYTTHRAIADPFYLSSGINLSEIFLKRFEYIEEKKKVLEYVENMDSWNSAKDILTKLSNELEKSVGNSILKICNYNVSDAVQLFASVLSNRQWTQRNQKVRPSFKIEGYEYYLSVASTFKAMALKNNVIFQNSFQIANLFYENGRIGYCLPLYILLAMKRKKNGDGRDLTIERIQDDIIETLSLQGKNEIEKERKAIEEIINYFFDKELIFEKISEDKHSSNFVSEFYISPRGENLLDHFLNNTILLELYRDDLYLDNVSHDTRCSIKMSSVELFRDIVKIIDEIGEDESEIIGTVRIQKTWPEFYSIWGRNLVTPRLIDALRRTFNTYYKTEIPEELIILWNELERKYKKVFDSI